MRELPVICKIYFKYLTLLTLCLPAANCARKPAVSEPDAPVFKLHEKAVDINSAKPADLEKLPHIGKKTARKIVAHREKFGRFRRPEHLLLVEGISDGRFRKIRSFVKTD